MFQKISVKSLKFPEDHINYVVNLCGEILKHCGDMKKGIDIFFIGILEGKYESLDKEDPSHLLRG